MPQGPILIFDKSALQMLSVDESVWLDNFFVCNITPLFFVETLADLEKELSEGKTAEQYVGALAHKTPDAQSVVNVHHEQLLYGELTHNGNVPMDGLGRPAVANGQLVKHEDSLGIIFRPSPEEEALHRWQREDFVELERLHAKAWRAALNSQDSQETAALITEFVVRHGFAAPRTFEACKAVADQVLGSSNRLESFRLGLALIGISGEWAIQVIERWQAVGSPPIRSYAPYFGYVCSVDLTFYLATSAGLIRNAAKASNKVDIAYLYYLPFCMVFTSNDRLHRRLAPLFLHDKQTFVTGDEIKSDLARLNTHFWSLPEEIRSRGMLEFAPLPPEDRAFLTTRLWDQYLPSWRDSKKRGEPPLSPEANRALVDMLNSFSSDAVPVEDSQGVSIEDCQMVQLTRQVRLTKGNWRRFSPEIEASSLKNK